MTPEEYDKWLDENNIFVSRPLFSWHFENWGFYILPAYHYYFFPRFYWMKRDSFIEFGVNFAGYHFEVQNNR